MIFLKRYKKFISKLTCTYYNDSTYIPFRWGDKSCISEIYISQIMTIIQYEIIKFDDTAKICISICIKDSRELEYEYNMQFEYNRDGKISKIDSTLELKKRHFNSKIPRIYKLVTNDNYIEDCRDNLRIERANIAQMLNITEKIHFNPCANGNNMIIDKSNKKMTINYYIHDINDNEIKKTTKPVILDDMAFLQRLYNIHRLLQLEH